MLKPRSFDVYINTIAPIIVMLDYLEIDIEISDIDIEAIESDDCKEVLGDNRDTNKVLAII